MPTICRWRSLTRSATRQQIIYATSYPFLPQQIIKLAGGTAWCTNYSIYTNATAVVTNGSLVLTNSAFGLLTRSIRAYGSPDAATNDLFYNGGGFVTNSIAVHEHKRSGHHKSAFL